MTNLLAPLQSLKQGHWFKLICGASFQHLPAVRSLTLAYTLAGADCIDVAADPAVIAAAQAGLQAAQALAEEAQKQGFSFKGDLPLLMVSLNDGEDPHFRKAEFNANYCPVDCPRPCEKICPAQAIVFNDIKDSFSGIIAEKCYGCGRCLPVCPYEMINVASYVSTPGAIAPLIVSTGIDAIEIHTKVGRLAEFQRLWAAIAPWADQLKLIAISCNDGEGLIDYLQAIYDIITPRPQFLVWQTDGRSMSGDIGDGTTIAAVKLGQKVLAANLPGYVQLAGGTNSYTVPKLKEMGMLKEAGEQGAGSKGENTSPLHPAPRPPAFIAGVAYGSYARVLLSPILEQLENKEVSTTGVKANLRLEDEPELLWQTVKLARSLVSQIKSQSERS
ncbi:4Fe-4S binding protein [Sphaerospermopsis aphanizomenoides BCCUSP55]|uniref:circadian clock protein LdpA n=1 Tax=Sphaerospermopsis aphanizomenoides TaxID=459663 RepID=UPI000A4D48ED|nr:LdpA C-terminal domain-containing domain [Sphaerospermopsis aphanizomenoides]MBK1989495.1 4Fe-4S binding protein [Sphaerospermopsis aphanizomenoides BCCUSP55]